MKHTKFFIFALVAAMTFSACGTDDTLQFYYPENGGTTGGGNTGWYSGESTDKNNIAPEEAARLTRLMRMNYETMHLFAMSRMERARCLTIMNEYYRLHLPDFPGIKVFGSLERIV